MMMLFKYQTLLCKDFSEIISITINHFYGIKELFKNQNNILNLINEAQEKVKFM